MAKFIKVRISETWFQYQFHCPGCNYTHAVSPKVHCFNGDMDKPTLSPSFVSPSKKIRCHSFIRDSKIQFLGDCTHKLKNQTVEIPEFEKFV